MCLVVVFFCFDSCSLESGDNGHSKDSLRLEQDILMPLVGTGKLFVFHTTRWWSQMKTAGYVCVYM